MPTNSLDAIAKKRKIVTVVLFILIASGAYASSNNWENTLPTDSSFTSLRLDLQDKIAGNLGKTLALLGFVASFVAYIFTHKGSVLFTGAVISLIAGGLVAIIATFFNIGTSGFNN